LLLRQNTFGYQRQKGVSKLKSFQALTEHLTKRCSAWDVRFLSAAGKEVLIESVAQAIPVYVMSVFLLPTSLHNALEHRIRQFWWGSWSGKLKGNTSDPLAKLHQGQRRRSVGLP